MTQNAHSVANQLALHYSDPFNLHQLGRPRLPFMRDVVCLEHRPYSPNTTAKWSLRGVHRESSITGMVLHFTLPPELAELNSTPGFPYCLIKTVSLVASSQTLWSITGSSLHLIHLLDEQKSGS